MNPNQLLARLVDSARRRPRLSAWLVLSTAICTFIAIEGRQVVLAVGQWLTLFLASILVAGVCVWIVSGDDQAEASPPASESQIEVAHIRTEESKSDNGPTSV